MRLVIPESLTQRACRQIRNEILHGRLDGHQRLTEDFFAKRYGISKSPIREALNRLETEGLIRIIPRRGAFVVHLEARDVEEIYELREILEACVVRNVELDDKTVGRLHSAVDRAEKYLRAGDKLNYVREDASFHTLLAQANRNRRLRKALENMHHQMIILRHRTFELSSQTSVVQHRRILHALEKGDRKAAEKLMVEHIRSVRDRLLKRLAKHKDSKGDTDRSNLTRASNDRT